MIQQQTRNIITGAVAIVLIGGGIVYYQTKKPVSDTLPAPTDTEQVGDTASDASPTAQKPVTGTTVTKGAAIQLLTEKKYDQAQVQITLLLQASPRDPELWYMDSLAKSLLDDTKGALVSIGKALSYDTQNITYWKTKIKLTMAQMTKDNIAEGSAIYIHAIRAIYEDALKITNSNIEIITPYAIYLEKIGDISAAISYWQKAITVNPLAKQSYDAEIARLKAKQ